MVSDHRKIIEMSSTLSEKHLAEIGRVTVQFALLEFHIRELVHWLLDRPSNVAAVITSELSFRNLYQLASALIKERSPELSAEFRLILKAVSMAEDRRNQISHSLWGSGGGAVAVRTKYSAKVGRGLHLAREEMTAEDIFQVSALVSVAAYDVESFHASLRDHGQMSANHRIPIPAGDGKGPA